MALIRQSRPDSGLCFQVKVLKIFQVAPFLLGGGREGDYDAIRPQVQAHCRRGFFLTREVPLQDAHSASGWKVGRRVSSDIP